MKQTLLILFAFASLFVSCGKSEITGCQPTPIASEKAEMIAYCGTNNITYTEHSSGILYQIIAPGTGTAPTLNSTVSVVYTGKLFNDFVFDATATPVTFSLLSLIDGWKIGIPLIKKGGRIKLVIPSALGYSCSGSGTKIPPNSPLFFDITLTDVQ